MTVVEHVGYDVGLNVLRCPADIFESTHKGVNQCSKDVTQTQQQRPEWPTVYFHLACVYLKVPKLHQSDVRVCVRSFGR